MAYSLLSQTPTTGFIQWANVHIVFDGVDYAVADGASSAPYIWWKRAAPSVFQTAQEYPQALADEDAVVFINRGGVAVSLLDSSTVDGGLVVPGTIMAGALAVGAVRAEHISANVIEARHIGAYQITAEHLMVGAVSAEHITAGAVTAEKIAAGSITAEKLTADAISAFTITAGSVTSDKLAANAVTAGKIAAGAIEAGNIAAGAIRAEHLLIAPRSLNLDPSFAVGVSSWTGFVRRLPAGNPAVPAGCPVPFAAEFSARDNPSVVEVDVVPGEVYRVSGWVNRGSGAGGSGVGWMVFVKDASAAVIAAAAVPGTPTTASGWQFRSGTYTIPANGARLQFGPWADRPTYTGEAWYADLAVEKAASAEMIVDGAISAAKIATGAITADKIAAGAITAGKIAAGAITATELAAGSVGAGKIAAGAVTALELAAETITADKIAANAITASELAANAVVADKIAANAVTAAKIEAGAITAAKIAAGEVNASHIAGGSITTGKLAVAPPVNYIWDGCFQGAIPGRTSGWVIHYDGGISVPTAPGGQQIWGSAEWLIANGYLGANYQLLGFDTGVLWSNGSPSGARMFLAFNNNSVDGFRAFPVKANTIYHAACLIQAHRCSGHISILWYTETGSYITESNSAYTSHALGQARKEDDYTRLTLIAQAPAGAAFALPRFGATTNGQSNPYVFVTKAMFGESLFSATEVPAWEPGGVTKISGGQIVTRSILADRIVAGSIGATEITAGAITSDKLAANSVIAGKIAAGAVRATEIAANEIRAFHLLSSEAIITNTLQVANLIIGTGKIATNAIITDRLADQAVTSLGNYWWSGYGHGYQQSYTTANPVNVGWNLYFNEYRSGFFVFGLSIVGTADPSYFNAAWFCIKRNDALVHGGFNYVREGFYFQEIVWMDFVPGWNTVGFSVGTNDLNMFFTSAKMQFLVRAR